jgi:hypothetical protein
MSGKHYRFSLVFLPTCRFVEPMRNFLRQTISKKACLVSLCLPEDAKIIAKFHVATEFFTHKP